MTYRVEVFTDYDIDEFGRNTGKLVRPRWFAPSRFYARKAQEQIDNLFEALPEASAVATGLVLDDEMFQREGNKITPVRVMSVDENGRLNQVWLDYRPRALRALEMMRAPDAPNIREKLENL